MLLATGMQYCPPEIPGLAELWGARCFSARSATAGRCADKRLAALAAGEEAVHSTLMLRGWSDDVVALTDGRSDLSPDDQRTLRSAGVAVDDRRIVELIGENGRLTEIAFADGRGWNATDCSSRRRCGSGRRWRSNWVRPVRRDPLGVGRHQRRRDPPTEAGGVFAAGDVCTKEPHLAGAIAAGSKAAMIVVQSLLADEFGLPYPPT